MSDHESATTPEPGAHELARLYLDALEDVMEPEEYADLRTLVLTLIGAMAEPAGPDDPPSRVPLDIDLTPAVHDEWLTVMGILGSGRMDQTIVDVGDGTRTVVDSGLAADPEALAAFRAEVRERNRIRGQEREFLDGIEAGLS
ncbi:hypothetical protein [Streptomyces triticiradicis]|uniref:Uncharacterized protein n=1 Tax=Streptomyces triticiradicis TaxID=2651189 RepID=A0A7J5DNG5_9ACTN|nr:hypothetical protein [Streptomyces triticiradicis]KAB1990300.1 hypothetical protein F8144_04495 [Streptomyces triticiradicis]